MTIDVHEPTPEFTRYLEWQVTSALRRHDRFAEPVRAGYARYMAAAAVIVISILIGAGGVAAAGKIQDNQQKQRLVAQQQLEVNLAQMQLELARKALDDAKRRVDTGVAAPADGVAAERDLRAAQLNLERARLNVDEVSQSSRPVQDEVTSPLVNGRDFVAERLRLEATEAALAAELRQRQAQQAKTRHDVGLATELELLESQAALGRAADEMRAIQERMALRAKFLAGDISVENAIRQRQLLAARAELRAAESALAIAMKRLALVKDRTAVGLAGEMDLLKAQLEMLSRQQDVEALKARIQALERGGQ